MIIPELKSLRVNRLDFESKQLIGKGHFGDVELVIERHTKDIYAMKVLKKDNLLNQRDVLIDNYNYLIIIKHLMPIYYFRSLFLNMKEILWRHQALLF